MAMRRAQVLASQLRPQPCIGEMANRQVDEAAETPRDGRGAPEAQSRPRHAVLRYRFVRHTIKIVFPDPSAADERYGGSDQLSILEGELLKPPTRSDTVLVFMHPSGIQNLLPMPNAMARAGLHVITCCSRYPNNDSCLIMEKVALDLGGCIRHAKEKLGYRRVVLCGWSGGGSLSSFYQAQAEAPTITHTPAGDRVDLTSAGLIPADALLILAAHTSRARIFTEWLDPAVLDEDDPSVRDASLDLYDPSNPNKPPFSADFIRRYREAQVERNRRITKRVREQLAILERTQQAGPTDWRRAMRDRPFNVYCTQADPRRLDTSLEPNGREPCTIHELASENHSPVGLARFTTLRSWLSQWSFDESQADGPRSLEKVTVPVLVLANGADHLVPLSHAQTMFDAVKHSRKEMLVVDGATHYYFGQTDLMAGAITRIVAWLRAQSMIEPEFQAV